MRFNDDEQQALAEAAARGDAEAQQTAYFEAPMDPEQLAEQEAAAEAAMAERLQTFGARLAGQRDRWVSARAAQGLDRQWADDLDQYNGKDAANRQGSMMQTIEAGGPLKPATQAPTRSTLFVQATRQKTNAAAARLSDVAAPTDERNFSISCTSLPALPTFVQLPTQAAPAQSMPGPAAGAMPSVGGVPVAGGPQPAAQGPQMPQMAGGPGPGPATAPNVAQLRPLDAAMQERLAVHAEARQRAEAMQQEIADCFEQCDFNAETRKVIDDMALFGTGVMEGPVVVNRTKKVWVRKQDKLGKPFWAQEVQEELKPASYRLDPRFFVPDPDCGDNVQNGRGAYKYRRLTAKQVRDLAKQPQYMKSQLRAVLAEGPKLSAGLLTVRDQEESEQGSEGAFELWVYWGEIDREDLIAAGVEVDDDELTTVSACVEMINSTVVRAYLNPLADGQLPFDVVPWERRPGSVWGYGVPYLMRAQQRVINAAWRMIMDNAGVSSGPQVVMKSRAIQPADKNWTITARKVWFANDDVDDVNKAFAVFEIPNRQKELQALIDMAEKLSDLETAVPMIAQGGERAASPETVGGMQLLMNSSNTMLRRLVKGFDDRFIKPHVRRYYDYLMEYSEREEIKGDFEVVALGSTSLVVRDIQNQAITNMLAMGGNPVYSSFINLKKLFERALKAQHIDPADVMNTDDEIARIQQVAAQNPPKDPRLAAAEARAQADMQRTEAQVAMNRETLESKQAVAMADIQARLELAAVEREIEMMKLAQKESVSLETIRAQLAAVGIKERSKQDMQAREIQLAAARGEGI